MILKKKKNKKKQKSALFWMTANVFLFTLSVVLAFFAYQAINDKFSSSNRINNLLLQKQEIQKTINTKKERRLLDGVYVKPELVDFMPFTVIIENHIDARPQSGLSQAGLVFEAETEGGITRFLAIFDSGTDYEKIGPIRSARPYFVDWAHEFSTYFLHVGGSPEALVKIKKDNILDLNEFYNEKCFWRDKRRQAPHNVYTSTELLKECIDGYAQAHKANFIPWIYKNDSPNKTSDTGNITIDFGSVDYNVTWKYNKENNNYLRFQSGEPHFDFEGEQIKAKNIAVIKVASKVIDEKLRLKIKDVGEGEAKLCLDGVCQEVKWQKKYPASRLRFYDADGNECALNAGTTWIEVVGIKD